MSPAEAEGPWRMAPGIARRKRPAARICRRGRLCVKDGWYVLPTVPLRLA